MILEGQKVAYAGDADTLNVVGSTGKVLAVSGDCAHVQWLDGPKVGSVDLVEQNELVPSAAVTASAPTGYGPTDAFDMSLEVPSNDGIRVRAMYDEQGEGGVIAALEESGHVALFASEAEESLLMLSARIATSASMQEVFSQLEPDERSAVASQIASTLLLDHLRES